MIKSRYNKYLLKTFIAVIIMFIIILGLFNIISNNIAKSTILISGSTIICAIVISLRADELFSNKITKKEFSKIVYVIYLAEIIMLCSFYFINKELNLFILTIIIATPILPFLMCINIFKRIKVTKIVNKTKEFKYINLENIVSFIPYPTIIVASIIIILDVELTLSKVAIIFGSITALSVLIVIIISAVSLENRENV